MEIYADNAATTKMYHEVADLIDTHNRFYYKNPSAQYKDGKIIREKIETAREIIASKINALPEEIFFTSGGTEGDNWVFANFIRQKSHIVTCNIEHKAVLEKLKEYDNYSLVHVDAQGCVNPKEINGAIENDTKLISIMFANNEIGTIQPITEIGKIAFENNVFFHTDAVQAFGHELIDVDSMNINGLSASAHKFHGPKGCGFLYFSKKWDLYPYLSGGGQEWGKRSGTENTAAIMGMALAADISYKRLEQTNKYMERLAKYVKERLRSEVSGCIFNGAINRLKNNISVSFKNIDGKALATLLDLDGIMVSTTSACDSKNSRSHVLEAIHLPREYEKGTIRITLSPEITMFQAGYLVEKIKKWIIYLENNKNST